MTEQVERTLDRLNIWVEGEEHVMKTKLLAKYYNSLGEFTTLRDEFLRELSECSDRLQILEDNHFALIDYYTSTAKRPYPAFNKVRYAQNLAEVYSALNASLVKFNGHLNSLASIFNETNKDFEKIISKRNKPANE